MKLYIQGPAAIGIIGVAEAASFAQKIEESLRIVGLFLSIIIGLITICTMIRAHREKSKLNALRVEHEELSIRQLKQSKDSDDDTE